MIIDIILDRKGFEEDGVTDYYNPKYFYDMMMFVWKLSEK